MSSSAAHACTPISMVAGFTLLARTLTTYSFDRSKVTRRTIFVRLLASSFARPRRFSRKRSATSKRLCKLNLPLPRRPPPQMRAGCPSTPVIFRLCRTAPQKITGSWPIVSRKITGISLQQAVSLWFVLGDRHLSGDPPRKITYRRTCGDTENHR